jgi:hypothetical protein
MQPIRSIARPLSDDLSREQREEYIAGYQAIIQENRFGRVSHYFSFMFHSIPGSWTTKIEAMKRDVARVHDLLMRHTVRKPNSPNWKASRPILIGCPDLPVVKQDRQQIRNFMVNDGLHFNAISLTPALYGPRQPAMHLYLPWSRIGVPLEQHFREKQSMYQTEHLYRIHVTPIVEGDMSDYTLKAFKNGRITADEITILK